MISVPIWLWLVVLFFTYLGSFHLTRVLLDKIRKR